MPSTVVTARSSAWTANIRHDRTAAPSTMTVQAPQAPCSQPRCVPVSPHCSRRKSASVMRGSTDLEMVRPFTVSVICCSAMVGLPAGLVAGRLEGAGDHRRPDPLPVRGRALQVARDVLETGHRLRTEVVGVDLGDWPTDG